MATPIVSGLAALLLSQNPGWSKEMARAQMVNTVDGIYEDVYQDGVLVMPAGTGIEGQVTDAQDSKRIGGKAKLALEFKRAKLASGADVPLYALAGGQGRSGACGSP